MLLPELPIVAHHRDAVDGRAGAEPRAVHAGRGTAARIRWCDPAARAHGVRPGQSLAAARSRCAGLESAPLDADALAQAQREVIAALLALTPRIAPDGDARFWVEAAPLAHGADERLAWCDDVAAALASFGPARIGVGRWALLAYAAALEANPVAVVDDPRALDERGLEALELDRDARTQLHALGVRTIGALRRLDRIALGTRLGPRVARARARADGDDPRGPSTPRAPAPSTVEVTLEEPLTTLEPLLFLLRPALARLVRDPAARGDGVSALSLELARAEGPPTRLDARSAHPIGDAATLFELLRATLDDHLARAPGDEAPPPRGERPPTAVDPGRRVEPRAAPRAPVAVDPRTRLDAALAIVGFTLRAEALSPLGDRTLPLFGDAHREPATEAIAIARLTHRLGEHAVVRASRVETASLLARAEWTRAIPRPGPALPWRAQLPPAPIEGDVVEVAGRRRRIRRAGRVERALPPWWQTGALEIERVAWLEVDGPLLVLVRERRDTHPPTWEAIAWVD